MQQWPTGKYGAILADPPWRFRTWNKATAVRARDNPVPHYATMTVDDICALPVGDLAGDACALFLWASWPNLYEALRVIEAWGFVYKSCAFSWTKAHAGQLDMFRDEMPALIGMGYWTRANNEPCLLATKGKPKRLSRAVRQAIIEPRRQHSRKPDVVRERIEQLVAGPYLELFGRQQRKNWVVWGDEATKFREAAE